MYLYLIYRMEIADKPDNVESVCGIVISGPSQSLSSFVDCGSTLSLSPRSVL